MTQSFQLSVVRKGPSRQTKAGWGTRRATTRRVFQEKGVLRLRSAAVGPRFAQDDAKEMQVLPIGPRTLARSSVGMTSQLSVLGCHLSEKADPSVAKADLVMTKQQRVLRLEWALFSAFWFRMTS